MSSHAIIVFIITVLCAFIQVEFQSKSQSPFETHSCITLTFFVVLLAYALSLLTTTDTLEVPALDDPNDNNEVQLLMSKISLFFGALASILLMMIVFPVLGWICLVLWIVCFLKNAFELVNFAMFQVIDKLSRAIHGQVDRLPV